MNAAPTIEDTPFKIAPFDPRLHVAPLELFDRLRFGSPPLLVDLRTVPSMTALRGTVSWSLTSGNTDSSTTGSINTASWPFGDVESIMIDDDGRDATATARRLRADGRLAVHALYGGLRLYAFTLHPSVVREDRFLRATQAI